MSDGLKKKPIVHVNLNLGFFSFFYIIILSLHDWSTTYFKAIYSAFFL